MHQDKCSIAYFGRFLARANELAGDLTRRDVGRLRGSGLQDELALLVRLQLLHLHDHLPFRLRGSRVPAVAGASLGHGVPHVTHLDAEGKLVT